MKPLKVRKTFEIGTVDKTEKRFCGSEVDLEITPLHEPATSPQHVGEINPIYDIISATTTETEVVDERKHFHGSDTTEYEADDEIRKMIVNKPGTEREESGTHVTKLVPTKA